MSFHIFRTNANSNFVSLASNNAIRAVQKHIFTEGVHVEDREICYSRENSAGSLDLTGPLFLEIHCFSSLPDNACVPLPLNRNICTNQISRFYRHTERSQMLRGTDEERTL